MSDLTGELKDQERGQREDVKVFQRKTTGQTPPKTDFSRVSSQEASQSEVE